MMGKVSWFLLDGEDVLVCTTNVLLYLEPENRPSPSGHPELQAEHDT